MTNKKAKLVHVFIILACVFNITCSNPIMEKWWIEEPEDPYYIAITKSVPQIVYETIIEDHNIYYTIYEKLPPEIQTVYVQVPPEILLQYIDIINIEFIIFAGDSKTYGEKNSPTGGTSLTAQEMTSNDSIINAVAGNLEDNTDYMLILHGHANPVTGTAAEALELAELSKSRADSVKSELLKNNYYSSGSIPLDLNNRITTRGYGGGRNISGSSSTYAGLNRRVEVILFEVLDSPASSGGGR